MTTTCPTCHAALPTRALEFLHERLHKKFPQYEVRGSWWVKSIAPLLDAYAAEAVDAERRRQRPTDQDVRIAEVIVKHYREDSQAYRDAKEILARRLSVGE